MSYKYYCITLFILWSISILGQPKSIVSQFDRPLKLYSDKSLTVEEVFIKLPRIYNLTDTTLVVTAPSKNYATRNCLIYMFSKITGKIIKELGAEDQNSEEWTGVHSVSFNNHDIIFFDAYSSQILRYNNIKNSVSYQSVLSQSLLKNLYFIDNTKFLSVGNFDNHMYKKVDILTGEGSNFLEYPFLPDISIKSQHNMGLARSMAYAGGLVKQPDRSRFAYFTRSGEYLQIIEISDSSIKEVMHLSFAPPVGKAVYVIDAYAWATNKMSPACFIDGTASKKFIYLLYSGKLFNDEDSEKSKYILVFDWNGSKIKMIELDKEVYSICVDEEDHDIFSYTTNNKTKKNEIIHFKL